MSPNTIPSLPIREDGVGILGPPVTASFLQEWDTFLKPFTFNGWLYIIFSKAISVLMRVALAFVFTRRDWDEFRNRFADYNKDFSEKWWRRLNLLWWRTAAVLFMLTMVFWEVRLAETVPEQRTQGPFQGIDSTRIGVARRTSSEFSLGGLLGKDMDSKQFNNTDVGFEALSGPNNTIDYFIGNNIFLRDYLKRNPNLCLKYRLEKVPISLFGRESGEPRRILGGLFFLVQFLLLIRGK